MQLRGDMLEQGWATFFFLFFPEGPTDLYKVSEGPQFRPFIMANWNVFKLTIVV